MLSNARVVATDATTGADCTVWTRKFPLSARPLPFCRPRCAASLYG